MRSLALGGIVVLSFLAAACDMAGATAPEADALRAPASVNQSVSPVTETTFSAVLVGREPGDVRTLPGGGSIEEATTYWESSGDWEGTFIGANKNIVTRNGVTPGKAIFTFEGTVLGHEGTLTPRWQATTKADGSFKARFAILSGTGELATLRGQGTNLFVGFAPPEIAGTVFVHFAP